MTTIPIPNSRLSGSFFDAGDPDEYGVTLTHNRNDDATNKRYPYCDDTFSCGDGSICNQEEWL